MPAPSAPHDAPRPLLRRSALRAVPLLLGVLALGAPAGAAAADDEAAPPAARLVELKLGGSAAEDPPAPQPFGPVARNFRGRLALLRRLAADPEVAGVELDVRGVPSPAHCLDLLVELRALRDAGKPIVCYAEMLDQRTLMLASVADLLVVPPSGMIGLEGLQAETMYLADLLARLDVRFELLHVGDYKTAYEELGRSTMSPELRETIGDILDEFYGQMLDTIADNRGMTREALEGLFADVLVDPRRAAEAGLIDAAVYRDEYEARLEARFGGPVERVDDYGQDEGEDLQKLLANPFALLANLDKILRPEAPPPPDEPYVAVVYATGPIASGKSKADLQGRVASMGSDTIVEALETVGEDEHCKAVVLRVNSPGGSALASDMIWRAVQQVREHKPVVASMGSVAASGGYWISMGCDAIVAQPSTITGSIGVVSMLPDVSTALAGLGVNVEVVARGPHGDQLSLLKHGVTPALRELVQRWMAAVYDEFLAKVAEGRGLPQHEVAALARGRVWTGRQAEGHGLVDALGGLQDALHLAGVMGGLDPATAPVAEFPAAPNFLQQLEESLQDMARAPDTLAERLAVAAGYGAVLARVQAALLGEPWLGPDAVQAILPVSIQVR